MIERRTLLKGAAAGTGLIACPAILRAQTQKTLKLSHQFPGGTSEEGDARDLICRKFAAEVEKRTNGAIKFDIYANSSLMKTIAQFSAMRKGALDLTLYPLSYAGGEVQEANLALMPALVSNYDQARKWRTAPIGQELAKILDEKGVLFVTWVWQSGSIASRSRPILVPEDVKGLKVRGGGREIDVVLAAGGGQVATMPSSEMYLSMQTGALDVAISASTSLISYRLNEVAKNLTAGRGRSFWFILEPLMIAKSTFEALTPDQQKIVKEVGLELEDFAFAAAKKDDEALVKVYADKGIPVQDMTDAHIEKWKALARDTAWKEFADKSKRNAELLKLAESVA